MRRKCARCCSATKAGATVAAAAVLFLTPFLSLVTHGIICRSAFGPVRLYALLHAHNTIAIPTLALQCPQPMNSTDWLRILDIWTHHVCTHSSTLLLFIPPHIAAAHQSLASINIASAAFPQPTKVVIALMCLSLIPTHILHNMQLPSRFFVL